MSNAARTPPSIPKIDRAPRVAIGAHADGRACVATPPVGSRPLGVPVAGGLLTGVSLALWLPGLAPLWLLLSSLAIGAPAWWRAWRGRWTGACLVGFALAGLHATHALSVQLPADWEKRDVEVRGRIVELPLHQPRRTAFALRVDRASDQPEALRGRLLRVSWYDERDGTGTGREQVQAGQRWQMTLRLRAPRGLRNPGGFDSEKHAFAGRVSAIGYVREPGKAHLERSGSGINAWRGAMSQRIADSVAPESARFLSAFALGDTRGLEDDDWHVLRSNGLSHLVAISGMHVGIVAGFFALAVAGFWWLIPGLGRRVPRPIAAAMGGLVGAMLYAAVAGFALPTVRTVLMVAVVAGMRIQRRRSTTLEVLALAMIAVLVVDPLSALTAGFWLSFFGVAWLVWCLPEVGRRPLHDLVSAQGVATIGLLPLTAVLFDQASLAGPLANLVAVPWWTLVVVPLSLMGTALELMHAGWGLWAWNAAAWCFQLSWPLFEAMAGSDLALWWLRESRWYALPLAPSGCCCRAACPDVRSRCCCGCPFCGRRATCRRPARWMSRYSMWGRGRRFWS
nr:ComEC/Rec2 family competence protein [Lysobacter antarcticus]